MQNYNNNYELSILVNGKPIREYFYQNKNLIEAKVGTEYSIKFRNNSWSKVLALFSVDGVNVLDGSPASDGEVGYVVDPYRSIEVKGFRINESSVAAFKFGKAGDSYASYVKHNGDLEKAEKDPSKNNGVIGVRVWKEKQKINPAVWYKRQKITSSDIDSWDRCQYPHYDVFCGAGGTSSEPVMKGGGGVMRSLFASNQAPASLNASFNVGTAWGGQVEDKVIKVKFEKENTIDSELVFYYLDRQGLIDFGVDVEGIKKVSEFPEPFGKSEFCKVPTNWK